MKVRMNMPTTRTEQILANASRGVSFSSIVSEAAAFIETGEVFIARRIQGLPGKAGDPQSVRSGPFARDKFMYIRLSSSLRLDRSLSNPCATTILGQHK